jgi:hypothetical protein
MPRPTRASDRRTIAVVLALFIAALAVAQLAAGGVPYTTPGEFIVPTGGQPLTGSVNLTDQTFLCYGPLKLKSLQVTIDANSPVKAAVKFEKGCTGSVGNLVVHQALDDGVDVGGATNLTVNGGLITCTGHVPGAHQDGIQVMSGNHITFSNMTVQCTTSTNSGFYVNSVTTGDLPTNVLFTHGTIDPAGSSTAFVNQAKNSGVEDSTLYPSRYFTYRKSPAAIDIGNVIKP